jgi:nicotinate-nucleotide adenylyltransferase
VAQEAYARLGLDRVWFLPAGQPPHKPDRPVTPATSRIAMVERAIAGDARFALSRGEVDRPGPSYTVETLRLLREEWGPSVELFFVLGWDMLLYLPHWRDPAGVVAALNGLVAVPRPGFVADAQAVQELEAAIPGLREKLILTSMPQVDISSTDIRQRVALGLPIQYLVPDTVRQYIVRQGLYRSPREQPQQVAPTAAARGEETA